MDGVIYLDETYDSGVPGNPGARFVVNLKQPPIDPKLVHGHLSIRDETGETTPLSDDENSVPHELPTSLSVLFVDDDTVLRKLFSRSIRTVAPDWDIREASNGETALRLVETEHFDLIFMDMYMASVEKQLLGTEAVRELRRRGVVDRICGLSANDKEVEFLQAGADCFCFKYVTVCFRILRNSQTLFASHWFVLILQALFMRARGVDSGAMSDLVQSYSYKGFHIVPRCLASGARSVGFFTFKLHCTFFF